MTRRVRFGRAIVASLALWLASAGPASAKEDCDLTKEAAEGDVVPVRLTCTTDLDPELLFNIVRDPSEQVKAFSSLSERTRALGDDGSGERIHQFHQNRMISDREVIVTWDVSGGPDRRVVAWQKAADQSGTTGQNVIPDVHEGYWEIRPDGDGATVTYYVKYLPSGGVPDKLVKAFVGKGVRKVVKELCSYARKQERSGTVDGP